MSQHIIVASCLGLLEEAGHAFHRVLISASLIMIPGGGACLRDDEQD
jgi:hypothetical protein